MKAADIIKKTGKTDGKSNREGGGGRSEQMKEKGMSGALISWIGRRKEGKGKFDKQAEEGRERAEKK